MISLHKADYLVHGNPIGLTGILARLNPTESSFTAVVEHPENNRKFFSQVIHPPGSRSAHFSFLVPDVVQEAEEILSLIDYLSFQAGEMGAINVLAEIEESHVLFEALRHAGFSVYSWESIWRLPDDTGSDRSKSNWKPPATTDSNTVRCLYQTLVPPLVQNAEPFVNGDTPRLLYRANGDALAYVESLTGSAGVYLVPLIHPSVDDVQSLLLDLIGQFRGQGKPVYMQVRSYQAWLSDALSELKAQPSPRFALMVKHLAVGQLKTVWDTQRARSEQRQVDPASPILNNCAGSELSSEGLKLK